MKKIYIKPALLTADVQAASIICTSVIQPGKPNTPAGSRRFGLDVGYEDEEEEDF